MKKQNDFNLIGFGCGLTLILGALKALGLVAIEWIWVFMPMIITYVPVVVFMIGATIVSVTKISKAKEKKPEEKKDKDVFDI